MTTHPGSSYAMGVQGDMQMSKTGELAYRIKVQDRLDADWSKWFSDVTVTLEQASEGSPVTTLIVHAVDQAKLRGILNKLWDMNLTVISMNRLEQVGGEQ
jgi:hypothetical protein